MAAETRTLVHGAGAFLLVMAAFLSRAAMAQEPPGAMSTTGAPKEAPEDWKARYEELRAILPDKYVELQHTSLQRQVDDLKAQREREQAQAAAREEALRDRLQKITNRLTYYEEYERRRDARLHDLTTLIFPLSAPPKIDPRTLQEAYTILVELRSAPPAPVVASTPAISEPNPHGSAPFQVSPVTGEESQKSSKPQYLAFVCFPQKAELYEEITVSLRIIPREEHPQGLGANCRPPLALATWGERSPFSISNDGLRVRSGEAHGDEWSWFVNPLKTGQVQLHFIIPGSGKGDILLPIEVAAGNPFVRALRWLNLESSAVWISVLSLVMVLVTNATKVIDFFSKVKTVFPQQKDAFPEPE